MNCENKPEVKWDRPANYFGSVPETYIVIAAHQLAQEGKFAGSASNLLYSAGQKWSGFSDSERILMSAAIRDRAIRLMVDDFLVVRGEIAVGDDLDYRGALNRAVGFEIGVYDHFKTNPVQLKEENINAEA